MGPPELSEETGKGIIQVKIRGKRQLQRAFVLIRHDFCTRSLRDYFFLVGRCFVVTVIKLFFSLAHTRHACMDSHSILWSLFSPRPQITHLVTFLLYCSGEGVLFVRAGNVYCLFVSFFLSLLFQHLLPPNWVANCHEAGSLLLSFGLSVCLAFLTL